MTDVHGRDRARRAAGRSRLAAAAAVAVLAASASVLISSPATAVPPPPTFHDRTVIPFPGLSRLAVADLNEDGRADLVGTQQASASHLWVALASGPAGSFAPRSDVPLAGDPGGSRPLVADLDGDGHLDILVVLNNAGYVWQLGNGDGTFEALQTSPTVIFRPVVGDVVGSDAPDLVATINQVPTALVGDGTGAFTATSTTFSIPGAANDILVEDLDDDGHDDVAVSVLSGNPSLPNPPAAITTFRAKGDGTFEPAQTHDVISILGELDAGDLDGDGDLDLAVAAPRGNAESGFFTLLGSGTGAFAAPVLHLVGSGASEVHVTDVDGDLAEDIVLLDRAQDVSFLVAGMGDGTFGPAVSYGAGRSAQDLALVDITGDGHRDLVNVTASGGGRARGVNVLPGRADHTFAGVSTAPLASTSAQAVGDLTGDGLPDLVAARSNQIATLGVYANDGRGRLLPAAGATVGARPTGLATGRLDGDADDDVAAVSSTALTVALSAGDGSFTNVTTLATGASMTTPVIADLTGDAHDDVAVADGSGIRLFAGKGNGAFAAPTVVAGTSGVTRLATGDLDGDGHDDLIGIRSSPAGVVALRRTGTGGFAGPVTVALPAAPQFVATGDLDGDGRTDVAATAGTGATSRLHSLFGTGDGGLVAGAPVVLPDSLVNGSATASSLTIGDFGADGRDDAIVDGTRFVLSDCAGPSSVSTGTFDSPEMPSLRADAVDMDGDGTIDLVGATYPGDAVVRLGVAPPAPAASPAAPFRSCRRLVDQVHRDLLQRAATPAEVTTLAAGLAAGTLTKGDLVAQIRTSAEHTANVDPVARLYRAYFLRSPDPSGLDYWVKRRRAGATLISISNQFARSSEFQNKYGKLSNTKFVDLVYQNVLGRPGDAGGRAFWIKRLDTKKASRGQVMLNFSDSGEYRTKQAAEVDTGVLYAWMLRRRPTTPELDAAVAALENGGTTAQLATQLLGTVEYATRVGAG